MSCSLTSVSWSHVSTTTVLSASPLSWISSREEKQRLLAVPLYRWCEINFLRFSNRQRRWANMTPNIWNSKSEIRDEEELRKKNHSRVTSAIVKDEKSAHTGYKARKKIEEWLGLKTEIKWTNVVILTFFHMGTLYSFYTVNIFGNFKTLAWSEYPSKNRPTFIN